MVNSPLRSLAAAAVAATAFFTSASAQSTCNGHAEYCDRKYSNVSIVGAHNSYAVQKGSLFANQNYTAETQLNNGIRLLQVQGHLNNNELHLCHTSCSLLDGGSFTSYLSTVKSWLDANPDEVVTLLMVNSDGIAPSVWAESYTASGLSNYTYTPASVPVAYDAWPTYGELIGNGTRVVSFLAQNADVSEVPYLLDEFTNIWETPYDETDNAFPCTVDRVTGTSDDKMYLMNHFLDYNVTVLGQVFAAPDTGALNSTNAATGSTSLGENAASCLAQHGYYPTFTLVDYYDMGNGSVFEFAANLNGVTYTPVTVGHGTSSSTSGSSGSPAVTDNSASSSLFTGAGAAGLAAGTALLVSAFAA
ncbi:hypothetical protein JCM8097_004037 [Rhodosporidiobolus ruineniae]